MILHSFVSLPPLPSSLSMAVLFYPFSWVAVLCFFHSEFLFLKFPWAYCWVPLAYPPTSSLPLHPNPPTSPNPPIPERPPHPHLSTLLTSLPPFTFSSPFPTPTQCCLSASLLSVFVLLFPPHTFASFHPVLCYICSLFLYSFILFIFSCLRRLSIVSFLLLFLIYIMFYIFIFCWAFQSCWCLLLVFFNSFLF